MSSLYLCLYLGLWIISFAFLKMYFKNSLRLGILFIVVYGISALAAVWVVNQSLYYKMDIYRYDIVSFDGLLFLFVVLILFATPLFLIRTDNIKYVYLAPRGFFKNRWKEYFIYCSVILFIIVALISCYGRLPYVTAMQSALTSFDAGGFDKGVYGEENHPVFRSNSFFRMSFGFFWSLKDVMLCFSFYFAVKGRKKIASILFLLSFFLPILFGIFDGARQQIMAEIMTFSITYFLFRESISNESRKRIKKVGVFVLGILLALAFFITVMRFGDDPNVALFWIFRYLGEPALNFASQLFEHQSGIAYGLSCFPTWFGIDFPYRSQIVAQLTGVQAFIFYTFIGDFMLDIGAKAVLILGVIISLVSFVSGFFRVRNYSLSMGKLILFQTWAILCIHGVFFFQYMLSPYSPIFSCIFALVLNINFGKKENEVVKIPMNRNLKIR